MVGGSMARNFSQNVNTEIPDNCEKIYWRLERSNIFLNGHAQNGIKLKMSCLGQTNVVGG